MYSASGSSTAFCLVNLVWLDLVVHISDESCGDELLSVAVHPGLQESTWAGGSSYSLSVLRNTVSTWSSVHHRKLLWHLFHSLISDITTRQGKVVDHQDEKYVAPKRYWPCVGYILKEVLSDPRLCCWQYVSGCSTCTIIEVVYHRDFALSNCWNVKLLKAPERFSQFADLSDARIVYWSEINHNLVVISGTLKLLIVWWSLDGCYNLWYRTCDEWFSYTKFSSPTNILINLEGSDHWGHVN